MEYPGPEAIRHAVTTLNPIEAWVIRERYGIGKGGPGYLQPTYMELERDCGLSTCRIHQIEQIALSKMVRHLGLNIA